MTDAARHDETFVGLRLLGPVAGTASAIGAAVVDSGSAADTLFAALGAATFFVWAAWPRLGTLALVLTSTPLVLLAQRGGNLEPALFMLSIAATIAGLLERSRWRLGVSMAVLLAAPTIAAITVDGELAAPIWTAGAALPFALTRIALRQQALTVQLAEARAALADQKVAEERRRIARDVHDSVGHGLAAMLIHITGARHVLRRDADAADEALAEAEDVGRRSMLELRQTLGLLRAADAASTGPAAPVPTAAQLGELGVEVIGDPGRLDPLVATSLHRVASEALANVRQHASGPPTLARLVVGDERAELTIESPGHATPAGATAGRAHYGIVGMSERMAAVGGELLAGPTPDGWIVQASAPIAAPRRSEVTP